MEKILNSLPQNRFVSTLRTATRVSQEFKAAQRVSGAGGQLGYLVQTDDTWDLTETLTAVGTQFAEFELTYTGDGAQDFPIVLPYVDLRVNGTDDAHKPSYLYGGGFNGVLGWTDGTNTVFVGDLTLDPGYLDDQLIQKWTFTFTYQGTVTYYLKALASASSGGTVSLVRTV